MSKYESLDQRENSKRHLKNTKASERADKDRSRENDRTPTNPPSPQSADRETPGDARTHSNPTPSDCHAHDTGADTNTSISRDTTSTPAPQSKLLLRNALFCLKNAEYSKAARIFDSIIHRDGKDNMPFLGKALCYFHDGYLDQARKLLWTIHRDPTIGQIAKLLIGDIAITQKKFRAALFWLNFALDEDPAYGRAHALKGKLHFQLSQFEAALDCYRICVSIDPTFKRVYQSMGLCCQALEQYRLAVCYYTHFLSQFPRDIFVYRQRALCYSKLADTHAAALDLARADRLTQEYVKRHKTMPVFVDRTPVFQLPQADKTASRRRCHPPPQATQVASFPIESEFVSVTEAAVQTEDWPNSPEKIEATVQTEEWVDTTKVEPGYQMMQPVFFSALASSQTPMQYDYSPFGIDQQQILLHEQWMRRALIQERCDELWNIGPLTVDAGVPGAQYMYISEPKIEES